MNPRRFGIGVALIVAAGLAIWLSKTPSDDPGLDSKLAVSEVSTPAELSISIDADMLESVLKLRRSVDAGDEPPEKSIGEVDQEYLNKHFVLPQDLESDRGIAGCVVVEVAVGDDLCWDEYGYHPYLQYDYATLTSLAPTDPVASAALAMMLRHEKPEASLYYAMQASNQTNKSGPLVRYVTDSGVRTGDVEKLLDLYAIALYAQEAGWDRPISEQFVNWLINAGLSEAEINERMNNRRIDASLEKL